MSPVASLDLAVCLTTEPGQSIPVGRLIERERRIFFEYGSDWVASKLELSPLTLPVRPGLIEHTARRFGPLPGLFDDSLPDGWGRLLMDHHFRKIGLDPQSASPLQRLAWLGTRTMGALTYHPPSVRDEAGSDLLDLDQLAEAAGQVLSGASAEVLPQLLRAGGSPGGARPKVLVGYHPKTDRILAGDTDLPEGFEHWLIKFPSPGDRFNTGPVEFAYASMAVAANLRMPPTRLFETEQGERFFGIRRFDRAPGNRRLHMHTFGNLIESDFRIPSCDYRDLFKATTLLTRDRSDLLRAFRWMAFNVLAHNRDDHVKNFAFLFDPSTNAWSLSPAYDLTFAPGPGGEHSMTIDGEGRHPTSAGMVALGRDFDLPPSECKLILDEVREAISHWLDFATSAGVSKALRTEIARAHRA